MVARVCAGGFTLIELALLLALLSLLSALAVPSLSGTLAGARTRSTLDRITADLYLARAQALRDGREIQIRFDPSEGCAERYEIVAWADKASPLVQRRVPDPDVCLRSNATTPLRVNARGMLIGSPRKLYASSGGVVDSLSISFVGRVHRWR